MTEEERRPLLYLAANSSSMIGKHPDLGVMVGPRQGGFLPIKEGRAWAGDCDGFTGKFDPNKYIAHLERMKPYQRTCLFFTAPDEWGDWAATKAHLPAWVYMIRHFGYKAAVVTQPGIENEKELPDVDALFLGGPDEWREPLAPRFAAQAKERGLYFHVGRVNSRKRTVWASTLGADSVDGTFLSYAGQGIGMTKLTEFVNAARSVRGIEQWSAA